VDSILDHGGLPAPLGPRTPKISPSPTCRLMPSRAVPFCAWSRSLRCRSWTSLRLDWGDALRWVSFPAWDLRAGLTLSFFFSFRWWKYSVSALSLPALPIEGRLGRSDRASCSTIGKSEWRLLVFPILMIGHYCSHSVSIATLYRGCSGFASQRSEVFIRHRSYRKGTRFAGYCPGWRFFGDEGKGRSPPIWH